MKKIFIAITVMLAAVAFTSCNQDLLNIQQKGAVSQEEFYQTDDDALAAITAVYAQMRQYYYNYKFFTNLPSDNIYCGGGSRGDNDQWAQLNEFRTHAQTGSLSTYYRTAYNIIFKCNLLINNMEPNTAVTKRAIAEARFFRAWAHMVLTEYWGTPPLITEVLNGSEKPANTPKAELWKFIIDEFAACANDLPSKANKNDKNAVCRITKECALAYQGKAQVLSGDYAGAKTTLKKVIDSGKYDLVPSDQYKYIWCKEGDLSEEVVMTMHVTENGTNTYDFDMLYLMWGWRADHVNKLPTQFYNNSWGFMNPTKDFFDAFVAHDGPDSYRIRASVASYDQVMQMDFGKDGAGNPIQFKIVTPLHGHEGYFDLKYAYYDQNAVKSRGGYSYINDRMYMRYAEVLLLYAEACAQAGDDGSGLAALNKVQARAGAPLTPLTLQNVKDEKRFELYLESCRFVDLVRWGDAPKALAGHYESIPEFQDGKVTWNPYNTGKVHGFQAGKNELYPFPYSELQVNENLVQNPGY